MAKYWRRPKTECAKQGDGYLGCCGAIIDFIRGERGSEGKAV